LDWLCVKCPQTIDACHDAALEISHCSIPSDLRRRYVNAHFLRRVPGPGLQLDSLAKNSSRHYAPTGVAPQGYLIRTTLTMSAIGPPKQTWPSAVRMSAFDPKQTC